MPTGALDVFIERHLDPAMDSESDLRERLDEVNMIDLHGWLTRVMLAEYKVMGDRLYPGPSDGVCLRDGRAFCAWLGRLARRKPLDFTTPLKYQGRYLSAGIIFVAMKGRLEREGLDPYRKRAKRLIYQEKCNVVYLMARDDNIPAAKELRDILARDALIEEVATYEYPLRSDFRARVLHRERAVIIALTRRQADEVEPFDDEDVEWEDEAIEVYDFEQEHGAEDEAGEVREPVVVGAVSGVLGVSSV